MSVRVPLVDLQAQHRRIADEVRAGWARVLDEGAFIQGCDVAEFEDEFARFSGVEHCVAVANGTDALELLLRAAGVGRGDEVVLPANTFIATALAVVRAGATPVLVDCTEDHLIDVGAVAAKLGPRTRAVLPVHLFGQMADVDALESLVEKRGVLLLEDAAQSHGARRNGRPSGSVGLGAGVSFYPGKNLGAYGDAGAVLTRSDELARRLRALRNYGSDRKYHHPELGFNSRLDTLQAVVLRAKLRILAEGNDARRRAAARYDELLAPLTGVSTPRVAAGNLHVFHLYVVRVPRRDDVLARLHEHGIGAGIHYPVPLHLQGAFASLGHAPGDFPVAEKAAAEILSLPIYPEITEEQQREVVGALSDALAGLR